MSQAPQKIENFTPPILVWFRRQLRTHDVLSLSHAIELANQRQVTVLCVFCYSPEWDTHDDYGSIRLATHRKQFLLSTLSELKKKLTEMGSHLWVCRGKSSEVITHWVKKYKITDVFTHTLPAYDEQQEEKELTAILHDHHATLHLSWDYHLMRLDQLPFSIEKLPRVYTQFRKQVEKKIDRMDHLIPTPVRTPTLKKHIDTHSLSYGLSCDLNHLLVDHHEHVSKKDSRAVMDFVGGESQALQHVQQYIWEQDSLSHYKETRNGSLHAHESSKCSPWLAVGSLSVRYLWHETLRYESCRIANDSTYWLRFELLWREYFQWVAYQSGAQLFYRYSLKGHAPKKTPDHLRYAGLKSYRNDEDAFHAWKTGTTGNDFVNAHMNELNATGFMSNRGRQNVASYFIHDLGLDWRQGAGYLEGMLLDYDPASNWGNWAYIAGVGNDPRPFRKFNVHSQAQRYDAKGIHRKRWLAHR